MGEQIKLDVDGCYQFPERHPGIKDYIKYAGMPSDKTFSLIVTRHYPYSGGWAYNLFYPINQQKIKLERGDTFEVKNVTPDEIILQHIQ